MRLFFIVSFLLFSTTGFSYSCNEDCSDSCKVSVLGKSGVEPVCYAACRGWMAANCWDLSNPVASASGEMGANAYPAAATIMSARNSIWGALDKDEKNILRPFYGNIVDSVRLHLKSGMMDNWGDPPFEISLGDSAGQTYGWDVYIKYFRTDLDRIDRVTLIGHEICHTRQYVQRGQSLQKFGRDYFEAFAKDGGYEANRMEQECFEMESKIAEAAEKYFLWVDQHKRKWNFQVCNNSGFESIFVALGWPHKIDGFSLVPAPLIKGWYDVKKGQCRTMLTNLESDEAVDAFATTGAGGSWTSWGGGGGSNYCIDPVNSFTHGFRTNCGVRKLASVSFRPIENPWRTQGNGTYSWNLVGNPTHLKICNKSGKRIWGVLSRREGGDWMARGWYEYAIGQCRDWNLGVYKGSVYLYGETDGAALVWQDNSKPAMCAFDGKPFSTKHNGQCAKGGRRVHPSQFQVDAGNNTWNYNP